MHVACSTSALLLVSCLAGLAVGQDDAPLETNTTTQSLEPVTPDALTPVQERLAILKQLAIEATRPLPEGEQKDLRAVVLQTNGRVQWRPSSDASWARATVDHVLSPGCLIRTGVKSWMLLRVGVNSHVFVDSSSRVTLPQMVHAGSVLTTTVQVNRGRADIQVKDVGLTNDFSVLTPSGALAVRGTGMAVGHNALTGTRVFGARTNAMNAIAMRYYGQKMSQMLSGDAVSTQRAPNPAVARAMQTSGPAPLSATESQDRKDAPDRVTQAVSNANPMNQTARLLLAEQQSAINEELLNENLVLSLPGWNWYFNGTSEGPEGQIPIGVDGYDQGAVATAIYWDFALPTGINGIEHQRIAATFENALFAANNWYDPQRAQYLQSGSEGEYLAVPYGVELPTNATDLGTAYAGIIETGFNAWDGQPFYSDNTGSPELQSMLSSMNEFCQLTFGDNGEATTTCRMVFADALNHLIYADQQYPGYGPALTPYGEYLQYPDGSGNTYSYNTGEGDDCPTCPPD